MENFDDILSDSIRITYGRGTVFDEYLNLTSDPIMKSIRQKIDTQGYFIPPKGTHPRDTVLLDSHIVAFHDVMAMPYLIEAVYTNRKTGQTDIMVSKESILKSGFGYPMAKKSPMKEEIDKWKDTISFPCFSNRILYLLSLLL